MGEAAGEPSYFRLYTAFFQDPGYAPLRLESKELYGIFLSRHSLSEQNGWRDPGGRTFFYCTIAEACRLLGCKRSKAMAVLLELERQSLISRTKQGRGKPDRIYLHKLQDS